VTLEVLGPGGTVVRRYSSADPMPAVDVNAIAVNAAWQRTPDSLSGAAGAHRFVWDLHPTPAPAPAPGGRGGRGGGGGGGGGRGGLPPVGPGNFSVRLTVNGQSFTQPLAVRADPRERAR
jgi:hypothetical protein